MTPRKFVTVTPLCRHQSIHRLALNFRRSTKRAPATRAGYAASHCALPWNRGVVTMYASSAVSRFSATFSQASK